MIKIRHTFYAYNNGFEELAVTGMSFINNLGEAETKARDFLSNYYDQAGSMNIVMNQQIASIGVWVIAGVSTIDSDMAFVLIINRLP